MPTFSPLPRALSSHAARAPRISADLDGGNIEVVDATDWGRIELEIRTDSRAEEFRQWFHFVGEGATDRPRRFVITNAGETTYPDAWDDYRACASYDGRYWFRLPTSYEDGALSFEHVSRFQRAYYAYFAPYSLDRHSELLHRAADTPWMRVETIGETVEGRDMSVIVVGNFDDRHEDDDREDSDDDDAVRAAKKKIWIIARQHPGETMAEWFMEGLLERLLEEDDEALQVLLSKATLYLVPNMNPDGSFLGNLRTNAAGMNLNRAWLEPTEAESPEVLCVREAMRATGVDLFLDVHGDERNPYCFLAGCEGNPGYTDRLRTLENLFEQSLLRNNADFQDEYGYDRDEPGGGDLSTAGNWVGETFDCLSFTVEMPFKDNANAPDAEVGWSPDRAMELGASVLDSVVDCLDSLRGAIESPAIAAAGYDSDGAMGATGEGEDDA